MEARRRRGRKGGYQRATGAGHEGRVGLLRLLPAWLKNPAGFARPAPPPEPPLPLKFTCRGCGATVNPETGVCRGCKTNYEF